MSAWWYVEKQKKTGPVSEDDLRRLLQAGKIDLTTFAWQEGMEAWQPLGQIDALTPLQQSLPSPLPQRKQINPLTLPIATRWPRFLARTFDIWWESLLIAFIASAILFHYTRWFSNLLNVPVGPLFFGLLSLPVALIYDAVLYAIFGNTPGKALLGLIVTNLDGTSLSFGEYTRRNFLCWTYGYAFGVPIADLVTMYKQAARVHKGLSASYDERSSFRVHARSFSTWRATIFFLLFIVLLGANGLLIDMKDASEKSISSKTQEIFSWENPTTHISTAIQANWKSSIQTNEQNERIYLFSELTGHAVVIFGVERPTGNLALSDYVQAIKRGMRAKIPISGGGLYSKRKGYPAWEGSGYMTIIDNNNRVDVQVVQIGRSFWRIISIQSIPYDSTDAMIKKLERALWATII